MRLILLFVALPLPALAWEFRADPICTLTHTTDTAEITVTYDASLPEYAVHVTLIGREWPDAPGFVMSFEGANAFGIQSDRQTLSEDRRSLTVRDTGFGNVLNGLQFNETAMAMSGGLGVTFPLAGIAEPMEAFRACPAPEVS